MILAISGKLNDISLSLCRRRSGVVINFAHDVSDAAAGSVKRAPSLIDGDPVGDRTVGHVRRRLSADGALKRDVTALFLLIIVSLGY
jgi:hypothetical protein